MPDTEPSQASSLSERVYRALLVACPKEFRRAYGLQVTQVFKVGKYLSSAVPGRCSASTPGAASIGETACPAPKNWPCVRSRGGRMCYAKRSSRLQRNRKAPSSS